MEIYQNCRSRKNKSVLDILQTIFGTSIVPTRIMPMFLKWYSRKKSQNNIKKSENIVTKQSQGNK
ncbi:MAG: hypothetical protein ACTTKL_00060 [Treponema sp.]